MLGNGKDRRPFTGTAPSGLARGAQPPRVGGPMTLLAGPKVRGWLASVVRVGKDGSCISRSDAAPCAGPHARRATRQHQACGAEAGELAVHQEGARV